MRIPIGAGIDPSKPITSWRSILTPVCQWRRKNGPFRRCAYRKHHRGRLATRINNIPLDLLWWGSHGRQGM
jgi:hypothetical protein